MHQDHLKIYIFGNQGVGKTTLARAFGAEHIGIKGLDVLEINVNIENKDVQLSIWDKNYPEAYEHDIPAYFMGTMGGILVYDISRSESLANLETLMENFWESASDPDKTIPVMIVGNKSDLERDKEIKIEEVLELINKLKIFMHLECSAKTGKNVKDVFLTLVREIIKIQEVKIEK